VGGGGNGGDKRVLKIPVGGGGYGKRLDIILLKIK
jgi:hypothetical protein